MLTRLRDVGIAACPETFEELKHDKAGRSAEDDVSNQLAAARATFGEHRVWQSLRVPLPKGRGGRCEIDVVVLNASGVHVRSS